MAAIMGNQHTSEEGRIQQLIGVDSPLMAETVRCNDIVTEYAEEFHETF